MARESQAPWRDEELLRRKYVDEGKSTYTIGDELGCSNTTIWRWLKKFGIETREQARHHPPGIHHIRGYEVMQSQKKTLRVHQLLAISEGVDPYVVFGDNGLLIHHKNGIPWDNRPGNIKVMREDAHTIHHNKKTANSKPWSDRGTLYELYVEKGLSQEAIADKFGCVKKTISNWLHRHDIPVRNRGTKYDGDGFLKSSK